ncbi:MAG: hypothetical protein AB2704_26400, partial [Candidatus Thiodiazotropha taylori]
LVCVDEHKLLKDIERLVKGRIPQVIVEGYEPDPSIKAEPIQKQRNNNPRNTSRKAAGSNNRSRDGKKASNGKSHQSATRDSNKDQQKGKSQRKHNRFKASDQAAKPRRHSPVKRKKETAALLGG